MHRRFVAIILGLLCILSTSPAFAQAVVYRIDPQPVMTASGNVPVGGYPTAYFVPNATIKLCTNSTCTVLATTYTDSTGVTACASSAPVTLPGTNVCTPTAGAQGQFGFWIQPGTYYFTVTTVTGTFGPYPISSPTVGTLGGPGIVSSNLVGGLVPMSTNLDCSAFTGSSASVRIAACAAALPGTGGTLDTRNMPGPQTWNSNAFSGITAPVNLVCQGTTFTVPSSLIIPSNVNLIAGQGCVFSVTSGSTLTIAGSIDAPPVQIFAGLGTIAFDGPRIQQGYPQWWGAAGNGSTDDHIAIQASMDAIALAHGILVFPFAPNGYSIGTTGLTELNELTLRFPDNYDNSNQLLYNGTGWALTLGNASANTNGWMVDGLRLLLQNNGANGVLFQLTHHWVIRNSYIQGQTNISGAATNVCLADDGGTIDSFQGNIQNVRCNHVYKGFTPLSTGGTNTAVGIRLDNFYVYGDSLSGSKGIDFGASGNGDGYTLTGGDFEALDYGVYSNGGSGHGGHRMQVFGCRFEAIVTDVVYLGAFESNFGFYGCVNMDWTKVVQSAGKNTFLQNTDSSGNFVPSSFGVGAGDSTTAFTTGGFTGNNITVGGTTGPYFGSWSSAAGGTNWGIGIDSVTGHVKLIIQSGGGGTTYQAYDIDPASGNMVYAGTARINGATISVGGAQVVDAASSVRYSSATSDAFGEINSASGGKTWLHGDGSGSGCSAGDYCFYDATDTTMVMRGSPVNGNLAGISAAFASLPSSPNGYTLYCSNCKNVVNDSASPGATCVGSGSGAIARRENGHWACN